MALHGPPPANGGPKQERSRATRTKLIEAARRIFARDGFELARLEDIATAAGKTRGAFYANFEDKEDVFFAIFEEDLTRDQESIRERLSTASTAAERLEALTRHLLAVLKDKRRMLLSLEFKLYALRKPHRQKRLASLHAAMCQRWAHKPIDSLIPELTHTDPHRKRTQAAIIGAVMDGLTLNRLFDPAAMDEDQLLALISAGAKLAMEQGREMKATSRVANTRARATKDSATA